MCGKSSDDFYEFKRIPVHHLCSIDSINNKMKSIDVCVDCFKTVFQRKKDVLSEVINNVESISE